jgi:hypothetical protein
MAVLETYIYTEMFIEFNPASRELQKRPRES